jgi:hypothetical protein
MGKIILGSIGCIWIFLFSACVYLLPTFIALVLHHTNLLAIALLNIFVGWTVLGWVGALVWAVLK